MQPVQLRSQCLPNVSDPDRSCINGSDLLGACRGWHCTDKNRQGGVGLSDLYPSQTIQWFYIHDPVFGQESGPHVISNFLSSLDIRDSFCVFPDECHNHPSFSPVSFLSPASLALFPPSQKCSCSPSRPKQTQKKTLPGYCWPAEGVITGWQDALFPSCPSSQHTSHHTAQSQSAVSWLPSSQPAVFKPCFCSFPYSLIAWKQHSDLQLLSCPCLWSPWFLFVVVSLHIHRLPPCFTQSLNTGQSCGWLRSGASLRLHLCKRENLQFVIPSSFASLLQLWWAPADSTASLLCSHPTPWCLQSVWVKDMGSCVSERIGNVGKF